MDTDKNERIEKIEQKIVQLKNQKKAIMQREKQLERKARTKRLIEKGAIAEKYFGNISNHEWDSLCQKLEKYKDS